MRTTTEIVRDLVAGKDLCDDTLPDPSRELLLQFRFDGFVTFTLKEPVHPEAADKRFRLWLKYLNEYVGGRKAANERQTTEIYWVRALEWQKSDVFRYHARPGHAPSPSTTAFTGTGTEISLVTNIQPDSY